MVGCRNITDPRSRMLSFLHRALQPTVHQLTKETRPTFLTWDDVVFVGDFLPEDKSYEETYRSLAKHYSDRFLFGISEPAKEKSSVTCRNNVDDEEQSLTELWRVDSFENFIQMCARPLIPDLTRKNEEEIGQVSSRLIASLTCWENDADISESQSGKSIMHYFATSDAEKEQYRNDIRPLAKKYQGFVQFAVLDANEYADMLPTLGLKEGSKTGLALWTPNEGDIFNDKDIFPYTGKKKITAAVVETFLNDIIEGKLKPLPSTFGQGLQHDEL
jgi:protein disulfide-isomerase A1